MDNFNKACTEVWCILEKLERKEYDKIPNEVLEVIKESKDDTYKFKLDDNLIFNEQVFMNETRNIIYYLYKEYIASNEEKKEIKNKEKIYFLKNEKEKLKKYSVDVFEKKRIEKNRKNK